MQSSVKNTKKLKMMRVVTLVGTLAVFASKATAIPVNCACIEIYKPVCGSDGETYSNECEASCAQVSFKEGKCEPNTCEECVAEGRAWQVGQCMPSKECMVSDTGCYRDPSQCDDWNEMQVMKKECPTKSSCSSCVNHHRFCQYDPKHSKCQMVDPHGFLPYGIFINDEELCPAKDPEPEPCFCPMIYKPVCGSDGKTYSNGCAAGCAGVEHEDGPCPQLEWCTAKDGTKKAKGTTWQDDPCSTCSCTDPSKMPSGVCTLMMCAEPICQLNEVLMTPKGQCCPVCRKPPFPQPEPCLGTVFSCLADPCTSIKCPAYPTATCTPSYCNGCNAIFSHDDGTIISKDECKGNPTETYNCFTKEVWSSEKRAWCCKVKNIGCCSKVRCAKPICGLDELTVTKRGECCPSCVKKITNKDKETNQLKDLSAEVISPESCASLGKVFVNGTTASGEYISKCVLKLYCRKGLVMSKGALKQLPCECDRANCEYCIRTSQEEKCKRCNSKAASWKDQCVDTCPSHLTTLATRSGRQCVQPFTCTKGRISGKKSGRCQCLNANLKPARGCHSCEFEAGGFGQKCTMCGGGKYLNNVTNECDSDCDSAGEGAIMYKNGNVGSQCRAPFQCVGGKDPNGEPCRCAIRRCHSCSWTADGCQCDKCGNNKVLRNSGKCAVRCERGTTATGNGPIGRYCKSNDDTIPL